MNNQNIVRKILKDLDSKWSSLASVLYKEIISLIDNGFDISKAVNKVFKKYNVEQAIIDLTLKTVVQSAAIGIGKPLTYKPEISPKITNKILSAGYSGSELKLSKDIYSNVNLIKKRIVHTVKTSLRDRDSAIEISRKLFEGYGYGQKIDTVNISSQLKKIADLRIGGAELDKTLQNKIRSLSKRVNRLRTEPLKASYNQLLESIKNGTEKQIQKNLYVALQEKSRYHATIVARTEGAKAFYTAFESTCIDDPDVSGIQVSLSSSHRIYDICDVFVNIDLGYGKGVYPLSSLPKYPLHPHCFCQFTKVFLNKIPKNAKILATEIDKSMKRYFDKISKEDLAQLLGVNGAKKYLKNKNWQDNLRNYSGFHPAKSVLNKDDF